MFQLPRKLDVAAETGFNVAMQPTEAELKKYFEGLEDEQLVAAFAGRSELTELAADVLTNEVRSRRLQPAETTVVPSAVEHLDSARIVTLRRFASLPEALAARGAVEAAGIQCFLRDENAVRTMWHLTNFLGGTRLDVLESDQDAAEAALVKLDAAEDHIPTEENVEQYVENDYVCPQCGSWDVNRVTPVAGLATIASWILGHRVSATEQRWRCNNCKATWIDDERE